MVKLDHFFDPIIDHHLERLRLGVYDKSSMGAVQAREYASVRLGLGRQMGHSAYIARSATKNDLILCLNKQDSEIMTMRCKSFGMMGCAHITESNDMVVVDGGFNRVWIDNASYVSDTDLKRIYETYMLNTVQFILIG